MSYDANGNRTMAGYQTGPNNQLLSDGTWTYVYDLEGNRTEKIDESAAVKWVYFYDHANRLTRVERRDMPGTGPVYVEEMAVFGYDVFGNRIESQVDADGGGVQAPVVTRFTYDGQHVWADLDGSSSLTTRRLYGDVTDQLVARVTNGDVGWYLTDHLGSVRAISDHDGSLVYQASYNAFGGVTDVVNPTNGDRYGWTGREYEAVIGLQYNRARWYDHATGQWLSEDPIGFDAGDYNLRRYVGNSAPNRLDPSGLDDIRIKSGTEEDRYPIVQWMREGWFGRDNPDEAVDLGIVENEVVYFHPRYGLDSMPLTELEGFGSYDTIEDVLLAVAEHQGKKHYWHWMVTSLAIEMYPDTIELQRKWGRTVLVTRDWEWFSGRARWETSEGLAIEDSLTFEEAAKEYHDYLKERDEAYKSQPRTAWTYRQVLTFESVSPGGRQHLADLNEPIALTQQAENRWSRFALEELKWTLSVDVPIAVVSAFVDLPAFKLPKGFQCAPARHIAPVSAAPPVTLIGQGDRLAQAAKWIKPQKGVIDVVVHGSPDAFHVLHNGKWVQVNHRTLATLIEKSGQSGESIRLISCSSGANPAGIAQNLANKTGLKVTAPTDTVWIHPNGNLTIGKTATSNTGQWTTFTPGGP